MKINFTKNKGMFLIVVFVVLVVYNMIAFVLPLDMHGGFWVGYGFSMLAILLTTCVGLFALGREGVRSKFYGMPLVFVALAYLVVQFIVGFFEMILPSEFYRFAIVLNVIILAICLIGLNSINAGKEEIERIDEKIKEKIICFKALQIDVEGLTARVSDQSTKKIVEDLAESIRYSDPMSSPQLAVIEKKIIAKVSTFTENIDDVDEVKLLCDELQKLLADRNRKCKILK